MSERLTSGNMDIWGDNGENITCPSSQEEVSSRRGTLCSEHPCSSIAKHLGDLGLIGQQHQNLGRQSECKTEDA